VAQSTIAVTTATCPAPSFGSGSSAVTVPCSLNVQYTLSTAPNPVSPITPVWMGINSGHNNDTSWMTYMKRLGVNGVRIFGLAGSIPSSTATTLGLQSWVVAGGGTWGADFSGVAVSGLASFQTAVSYMRSYNGHTPSLAFTWSNPPRWATFEGMLDNNLGGPTGGSLLQSVTSLQGMGIEPLLVFWLSCSNFAFSTLDVSNPTYWAQSWELYKHTYMAMRWAYMHGVRKFEFWNEPDLSSACVTYYSWLNYYAIQTTAIQNAFADLSQDVANGLLPCPVANCATFKPIIYASAFAQASFSGVSSASTGTSPYLATFPGDYYPTLGRRRCSTSTRSFRSPAARGA